MKVVCQREALLENLGLVEKASARHANLPVLACVYVEARKGRLLLRATNLELGIEAIMPAKVAREGSVAVSAPVFYSTISSIYGSQTVTLELVKGNLLLSTATSKTLIKAVPHDDFPTLPTIKDKTEVVLPTNEFLRGIRAVWYSASLSSIKPELASVYVFVDGGKMYFAATDSFRLAEKHIPLKKAETFNPILIPFRNIADIIRVLDQKGGDMTIHISDNQIAFVFDSIYVTSRLVDGTFPDYRQIIPKKHTTEVTILKEDILNGLKITNIFSDKFNRVDVLINPKQKIFELKSQNADIGENITKINAVIEGDPINISFNQKYITDCFQSIPQDSISFYFTGKNKPLLIRGVGEGDFLYLVMPINN